MRPAAALPARPTHADQENPMTDTTTCDCGDPNCMYVANLQTAIDWLANATGQDSPNLTEQTR